MEYPKSKLNPNIADNERKWHLQMLKHDRQINENDKSEWKIQFHCFYSTYCNFEYRIHLEIVLIT